MAEYLKLHPEMAHELMAPSGFIQRLIRRYERYLNGTQMLSTQNGTAKKAQWDQEVFDAILPGEVHVVENPTGATRIPTWRELSLFVCRNGTCTLDGEAMAPQYEYKKTGEKVRLINYGWVEIAGMKEKRHSLKSKLHAHNRLILGSYTHHYRSRSHGETVAPNVGPHRMPIHQAMGKWPLPSSPNP